MTQHPLLTLLLNQLLEGKKKPGKPKPPINKPPVVGGIVGPLPPDLVGQPPWTWNYPPGTIQNRGLGLRLPL